MVHIEIDDKKIEVRQGQMIIEAADQAGISIPRFCYHKKLSIAANCRMCLVDVANAPKPLPACATPVSDGMKIFTKSARAIEAQKAVMEFLLINHPLDCPICDQGGQCELQDVALEYGKDNSRYTEGKRVVKDKDIGPLISTEMTRCIHCTRCVRFGAEIAGVRELGATGRGEFMEIGTYIEQSVNSELSGNVIDLCPVGALTSKPFRFTARAWELQASPSVSPHDCLGSNLFFHRLGQKVMRALPRENEALNEVWLSDRDRFSYEGLNHPDRLQEPQIKVNGSWQAVGWAKALDFAAGKLKNLIEKEGPHQLGVLASPNSTVEEFYLLQKLFRSKGCFNIDHRLRQVDSRHQTYQAAFPSFGINLSELENQNAIILIGSDIRKEQPLISHRVRKATMHGATAMAINPWEADFNFSCHHYVHPHHGNMVLSLLEIIQALYEHKGQSSATISQASELLQGVVATEGAKEIAVIMASSPKVTILLGALASTHPEASTIYALSRLLARLLEATWGEMPLGANSVGGWVVGAVPHRLPLGQIHGGEALSAHDMWQQPRKGYFLLNFEPEYDTTSPRFAVEALKEANAVVVLSAYDNPHYREYADVLLPITPISEMSGTYVNILGEWQNFSAAVNPLGQSRPAWKVLRVLANLLETPHFEYQNIGEVLKEILVERDRMEYFHDKLQSMPLSKPLTTMLTGTQLVRIAPIPLYAADGITRRASALQETQDANQAVVKISGLQAQKFKMQAMQKVYVEQDGVRTEQALPIQIDDYLPMGVACIAAGLPETLKLGEPFGVISLITVGEE